MPDKTQRIWLLVAVAILFGVAVCSHEPIPQDLSYHSFADRRTLLGVPNFWNVASNLAFLIVGVAGVLVLLLPRTVGTLRVLRPAFFAFFIGSVLVAVGSGFYHLAPNNDTLVFDRLPMTVAFMAFLSLIVGENIDPDIGRRSLVPLLTVGSASVLYWWFTESRGHGDLRPYVLVQFLPVVLIPLMIILFRSRLTKVHFIWGLLAAYGLAKALEILDLPIYRKLGVSGHTLKHIVAAFGMFLMVIALRARRGNPVSLTKSTTSGGEDAE